MITECHQINPVIMQSLVQQSLAGNLTWKSNLADTLNQAITNIETLITNQVEHILNDAEYKQLESSWRGLYYSVKNSPNVSDVHTKVLNVSKQELKQDFTRAVDYHYSHLFQLLYNQEFGTPGGKPYSILITDYTFSASAEDLTLLRECAHVAADAFCPLITAANPQFFGLTKWSELSKPRDLNYLFSSDSYASWHGFRDSEQSQFVTITLPSVLARNSYLPKESACWMNASYCLAVQIMHSVATSGWPTAIRGAENGGKVACLPIGESGPMAVTLTDQREAELSDNGFLPLCHYKHSDYAVFFSAQTAHKAKQYDDASATANAQITARLPYVLATSRFAHYLKVMARDKLGSFMQPEDCEEWLNRWILRYVNANAGSRQELKAKYPLAEAKIEVNAETDKPGAYHAIVWLKPWLQLEELTASMRLVTELPA